MQATKISVIGAGAWGTALALSFTQEHEVTLLAIDAAEADPLIRQRENVRFLPGIPLPESLRISHGADGLAEADLVLVVTPVAALREVVTLLGRTAPATPFLWACKGLEPRTSALAHQVVAEVRGEVTCGVLSGPSFAIEVAQGMPAAVCIASANADFARRQAAQLSNQRLRIYASDDLVGVEVSGAVKNVLAIAAGICDGLGLGHNARAALLTRGLAEIARFGMALGARRETFMGLAGMGDVILTCTGDLSRNRQVGLALAKGQSLADIVASLGHVAEGVHTAAEVVRRATALQLDMPIAQAVQAVLDGRIRASDAVAQLMSRDVKFE